MIAVKKKPKKGECSETLLVIAKQDKSEDIEEWRFKDSDSASFANRQVSTPNLGEGGE